jgi:hypothetical protein
LSQAEPRLRRRYDRLIVSQLSSAQRLAAGVHAPPTLAKGFATTQAAWRFYGNERVSLAELCSPLVEHARALVPTCCDEWLPVVLDWSNLHYNGHGRSKSDRIELSTSNDRGYCLFTALAVSDRDGSPIAPLCLELEAKSGLHTTRAATVREPDSQLDRIGPVMRHVADQRLGRPPVFIIDREADSVGHLRDWEAGGRKFVIRANDARHVLHQGKEQPLRQVARDLRPRMKPARAVLYKGKAAGQFVAETIVVLSRPACRDRLDRRTGKRRQKRVPGPALPLRLIVAEVRDKNGKVLARWLLLSNLPASVDGSTIALWYYWRWRIESYHKLLKSAGQQVEAWRQETAAALARRLLVTAMSVVLVWQIARDESARGRQLRDTLVKLSGRQMKRGKGSRGFTEPALLAGLGVLVPMMTLLEQMSVEELKAAADGLMPLIRSTLPRPRRLGSG